MTEDLSIIIPVKEDPDIVHFFTCQHADLICSSRTYVFDSGGGEILACRSVFYKQGPISFWEARRKGLDMINTEFILNLDADNLLPDTYVDKALERFKIRSDVGAIALNYAYPNLHGHLGFGTSIWRANLLKELYDWKQGLAASCECLYMWRKLIKSGFRLDTLPMLAVHLKGKI